MCGNLCTCGRDVIQPMTPNSFGTHNNVITVKESDFEAFEALGMDSLETGHHADNHYIKYGMLILGLCIVITSSSTGHLVRVKD